MISSYGNHIKISIFGESHSAAIGVTIEGLPAGFKPDFQELKAFMQRRAPGKSPLSTPRREADEVEILSGMTGDIISGSPLTAIIRNTTAIPSHYSSLEHTPRPGHADFTAEMKFKGAQAKSGGGHFSGRLTAPLCIAGGLALQILKEKNIYIGAHIKNIGLIEDASFNPVNVSLQDFKDISSHELPVLCQEKGAEMASYIKDVAKTGNSVGGSIECAVLGLPVGIGDPMFMGMENRISSIIFGIPAVKGIEFGAGFTVSTMLGSENNDEFTIEKGVVKTLTNNHGGILGGITSGMPLIFRAALKPTPSIFIEQQSVNLSKMEIERIKIKGRHDPCIVPRAVPCIEAAAAIAVLDAILSA